MGERQRYVVERANDDMMGGGRADSRRPHAQQALTERARPCVVDREMNVDIADVDPGHARSALQPVRDAGAKAGEDRERQHPAHDRDGQAITQCIPAPPWPSMGSRTSDRNSGKRIERQTTMAAWPLREPGIQITGVMKKATCMMLATMGGRSRKRAQSMPDQQADPQAVGGQKRQAGKDQQRLPAEGRSGRSPARSRR